MGITRRGIAAAVAAVIVLVAAPAAALAGTTALAGTGATARVHGVFGAGALSYDRAHVPAGATITVTAAQAGEHLLVTLRVRGLLPHREYGAHAHQRPCGPLPADAGGHFQHLVDPVQPSLDPRYANQDNEIWLDLTTDRHGNGRAATVLDWRFGTRRAGSVVLHDHHTATAPGQAGTAGPRYGCLTVPF